ncbi:hypothetical protein SKAU_G00053980 [Synaphobranchus kaupii]|uniref:Uncharacterized protein n=1 Tax=Synaphobranchus kaupii TaxID=118154 RepID=A0A9Q1G4F3_SYNKA|nr:hypothetical protein SKAU_G00053980 [Synaphobranchus kaupii]
MKRTPGQESHRGTKSHSGFHRLLPQRTKVTLFSQLTDRFLTGRILGTVELDAAVPGTPAQGGRSAAGAEKATDRKASSFSEGVGVADSGGDTTSGPITLSGRGGLGVFQQNASAWPGLRKR